MSGQGSPKFVFAFCVAKSLAAAVLLLALLMCGEFDSLLAQSNQPDPSHPMVTSNSASDSAVAQDANGRHSRSLRLRLSWGGGTAQTWNGSVAVANGTLTKVAPLGLDPDATAAVTMINGELRINHWSPTSYGGTDVTLSGSSETQIRISLGSQEQPESRFERTLSFAELIDGTISGEIDVSGNRCSVSRVPGDRLNVSFERKHLVFQPGERFTFSVGPNATSFARRTASCQVKLVQAYPTGIMGNRALASTSISFPMDEQGTSDPQELSFLMPEEEGIYNIEIVLEGNRYSATFTPKKNLVRRSIQLLVLAPQTALRTRQGWRKISTIDPVEAQQKESFPPWTQLSRITGLSGNGTLGNELRAPVDINQQQMMQLSPGGWQAIPLSVDRLGKPHVIELEYLADREMAIGVSLLQPDATGQIPSYGFDSGVHIPKSLVGMDNGKPEIRKHRLTVWPSTKTPYLLVANRHDTANAVMGSIRIFAGPDRIDPSQGNANPYPQTRKLMAFYEMPLFPESFGARETVDSQVARPLDDWRKFYEGADRFIEYLKANAYRGAFITVACDGSSIYPSQHLLPNPRFDNGIFSSSGQDPIRKDILEMLFRMFEREGLVLVPALALSGPLPEIEDLRGLDGADSDFELVDLNGTSRSTLIRDRLPVYNPLNRTVQHAVRRVVEELSERYKMHNSFDGVAIICRPDTLTLLPGRHWGYDRLTIQQFMQTQPDLNEIPNQWSELQNILLGTHRQQWIAWRAAQMTKWYQDLADGVKRWLPKGRLYLAPVDLYCQDETASALSPSLHSTNDFEQVMLHLGLEANLARSNQGSSHLGGGQDIVFLKPQRIAPDQPLPSRRVDLAIENSKQAQQFFARFDYAGDLFAHRISWAHFAQLEAQSPFGDQQSELMRHQLMVPAEMFNRKRFVQSIKNRDTRMLVDGGRMIPTGQEESILEMMHVFGQLPDRRFFDVHSSKRLETESRPLAVRQLVFENKTYFYVANASPWPTSVTLFLTSNASTIPLIESLSNNQLRAKPLVDPAPTNKLVGFSNVGSSTSAPESHAFSVTFQVPAYGLSGGRMGEDQSVFDFSFELPDDADKVLRRHVYTLQAKLTRSGNPEPLPVLENPEFEIDGQPTLAGWDAGQQSTGKILLVTNQNATDPRNQMGQASFSMSNENQVPIWVRSNVFEATETGRVSISVWLKTDDPENQPPLRLALEGQSKGTDYYRFGSVGSLSPDPNTNQLEAQWKRFAVHFDDLPVDGISHVRIGFDLMGQGQVSIDHVQVFDRWFDENDAKAITQMLASTGPLLSSSATFDSCRRLLAGYWPTFLDQFIEIEDATGKPSEQEARVNETGPAPNRGHEANSSPNARSRRGPEKANLDAEKNVPMFRRIRNLVPQRKPVRR